MYNEGILFLHSKLLLGAFGVLYYRWQSKAFAENVVTHTCTESEFWTPLYMFRYLYQQEPRQMMLQKITQIVQSNPSVSHSTEPLFVQIAKCICPDCKMYLLKLLNVLCQSDPSVSHSTQSLGPAHTPRGLKSDIWFLRYVTKYDTIHQNCNKKCVTVATAFSETGQTDWMSYWGERWGEGGFECESDTKIYQNITILYFIVGHQDISEYYHFIFDNITTIPRYHNTKRYQNITILYSTISPQYQDTTIPRDIRILPFYIFHHYITKIKHQSY